MRMVKSFDAAHLFIYSLVWHSNAVTAAPIRGGVAVFLVPGFRTRANGGICHIVFYLKTIKILRRKIFANDL